MGLERTESAEGRKLEKFVVEAVHSLPFGTVLLGKVGKRQVAKILECPLELLPGSGEASESTGFMKKLRDMSRGSIGRILQTAGLGCAAMAGACVAQTDVDTNSDHNLPEMSGQFGTTELALTGSDAAHFGLPQQVPWSEWDDDRPEITEYEGKKVIVFNRGIMQADGTKQGRIFYVECDQLEKCITDSVPQEIKGLQENFPAFYNSKFPDDPISPDQVFSFGDGVVFKDAAGKYKLLTTGPVLEFFADLKKNQYGVLEASNFESPPFILEGTGPVPVNGVPHLISSEKLTNLHTFETQELGYSTSGGCSGIAPHFSEEGSWVVAVKGKYEGWSSVCEFVVAATLDDLINKVGIKYLKNVNEFNAGADTVEAPRIGQNVLIYIIESSLGSILYYAVVQPYCGDGNADQGETFGSCPQDVPFVPTDTVTNPDTPDGGSTGPETQGMDISLDTALADTVDKVDTAIDTPQDITPTPVDTSQDVILPPDVESDVVVPPLDGDTSNDAKPDIESPCDFAEANVNITEGACLLKNCEDPSVDITGECTAEVDLGGSKPVILQINGTYQLDMLEKAGVLLAGMYELDDNGNNFGTDFGSYGVNPAGTVYGGEEAVKGDPDVYKVWCKEGKIIVSYDGEEIAVLNAGEEVTFDKGEDTSQADTNQPDAEGDEGSSEEDAANGKDTQNPPGEDTSQPGKDTVQPEKDMQELQPKSKKDGGGGSGGCSTVEHPQANHHLVLVGLALLALAGKRRVLKQATGTDRGRKVGTTM